MLENTVNPELAHTFGLDLNEFEKIHKSLGKRPNYMELCLLASTNITNKTGSSHHLIKKTKGLQKNEQAVLSSVKINDNLICVANIQSNSWPPYSDASAEAAHCLSMATRKIISSGATPLASINTFRFGLPEKKSTKETAAEFLKGVGEIGNATGYPVLGAKINFEPCFDNKPELNTMVIGLKDTEKITDYHGKLDGHLIYLIATEFNDDFIKDTEIKDIRDIEKIKNNFPMRPNAGFHEKLLIEGANEIWLSGLVSGMMAIDKNGLIHGLTSMLDGLNYGIKLEIEKLAGLESKKMIGTLISGNYANFIVLVENGKAKQLENILSKWELGYREIGQIVKEEKLLINSPMGIIAELPVRIFKPDDTDPCSLKNEIIKRQKSKELTQESEKISMPENLKDVAWFLIKHPNIASKRWINEQFDSMAGVGNMSTNFISDTVLISIKGTEFALAMCMTGNQKHLKADPAVGAQISIAAAARKMACTGAKPIAVIPGINFVNPNLDEDCHIYKEFMEGLDKAVLKFKLPLINESVKFTSSFNNQKLPDSPCPGLTIGMLGLLENKNNQMTISFKNKGNIIFIIGPSKEDISASEYLVSYHQKELINPPFIDLDMEYKIQEAVLELIKKKYVCSAHNISRGGLFISLVESAMVYGYGFDIITDTDIRLDAFLFGESQGRVLVSINPNKEGYFIDYMMKKEIPFLALGHVTKGEMRVDDISFGFIEDAKRAYENTLENCIKNEMKQ